MDSGTGQDPEAGSCERSSFVSTKFGEFFYKMSDY
jgi:hypothetical protein